GVPITVLADLQGPKLRLGTFAGGKIELKPNQTLRLDLSSAPGDGLRVGMPHPEIFLGLIPGAELLLDDGKVRLRITKCGSDFAETVVEAGTVLSDRKGVNVPGVILPLSPLTKKDLEDMEMALDMGADWIALSFVQRAEDIIEARKLINGRAALLAKIEKPSAVHNLKRIVDVADGL